MPQEDALEGNNSEVVDKEAPFETAIKKEVKKKKMMLKVNNK